MKLGRLGEFPAVLVEVMEMTEYLEETHFDGILGLGIPTMHHTHKHWFQSALDNNVVKGMKFAIWMNRDTSDRVHGGELTLGAVDETRMAGLFTFAPSNSVRNNYEVLCSNFHGKVPFHPGRGV